MSFTSTELQELKSTSPMMLQWEACKKVAGDAVLLFRMGDFYEAFYEDAVLLSRELELTLTKRQEIPMSGVPFHASDGYIDRLVGKGYRVAIAEQTEDPKKVKGLVKREVVRIVTPGSLISSSLLSDKVNNYFAAITRIGSSYGLAIVDLSTAAFHVSEIENEIELLNELCRLSPAEILTSIKFQNKHPTILAEVKKSFPCLVTIQEDWHFEHQAAHDFLLTHLQVKHLDGFGLNGKVSAINAAGTLLQYIHNVLNLPIQHLIELQIYSTANFMILDRNTQRNLELTESLHESGRNKNTLLNLLDQTQTPMGARLLRQWIKQPLMSVEEICKRQDAIEIFQKHPLVIEELSKQLEQVRDIERLMMRVGAGYASPRDLVALRFSCEPIAQIKTLLQTLPQVSFICDQAKLDSLPEMIELIAKALVDSPPLRLSDGNLIRSGFHAGLDEIRSVGQDSQSWLSQYQSTMREQTGIKTIKVGFNRLSGYYIEVSKGQADKMPANFQRRQTLTNAERFITPELKQFETKIFSAEERIALLESELFNAVRSEVMKYAPQAIQNAHILAKLDCLRSLAEVARKHHYSRPVVDESSQFVIKDGRHPVIEAHHHEKFVPNDLIMDDQTKRLIILTGPNMAGKSTYIRQAALIAIMAQIGSFVPAKSAHIGVLDKVFTRIGASDDLSRGQSTFMVEMTETANILNNATSRSLVILDEIGRGTSTYDGISIAWAVAEHLLLTEGRTAKTLFATHYWELTKLEGKIPGAVNYNVAVHETADQIIFLRKIVPGGTDKSYGIQVGRLAGMPSTVISRAKEILIQLEENANRKNAFEPSQPTSRPRRTQLKPSGPNEVQMTFFELSKMQ